MVIPSNVEVIHLVGGDGSFKRMDELLQILMMINNFFSVIQYSNAHKLLEAYMNNVIRWEEVVNVLAKELCISQNQFCKCPMLKLCNLSADERLRFGNDIFERSGQFKKCAKASKQYNELMNKYNVGKDLLSLPISRLIHVKANTRMLGQEYIKYQNKWYIRVDTYKKLDFYGEVNRISEEEYISAKNKADRVM